MSCMIKMLGRSICTYIDRLAIFEVYKKIPFPQKKRRTHAYHLVGVAAYDFQAAIILRGERKMADNSFLNNRTYINMLVTNRIYQKFVWLEKGAERTGGAKRPQLEISKSFF